MRYRWLDGYGGKDFEKRKVLRPEWKTPPPERYKGDDAISAIADLFVYQRQAARQNTSTQRYCFCIEQKYSVVTKVLYSSFFEISSYSTFPPKLPLDRFSSLETSAVELKL